MAKHRFKITVEPLTDNKSPPQAPLVFTAESHDDLIGLAAKIGLTNNEDLLSFFGLKLFGESLLQNIDDPLYQEIRPFFRNLMKNIKAKDKPNQDKS